MVVNLIIVIIINNFLKILFMRARPDINPLIVEVGYSFPSGHSMVAMGFYGYLIYLTWDITKHHSKTFLKVAMTVILTCIIILIGLSRIYLGVHFASDVIAGFVLSIAYLICYITIMFKLIKLK